MTMNQPESHKPEAPAGLLEGRLAEAKERLATTSQQPEAAMAREAATDAIAKRSSEHPEDLDAALAALEQLTSIEDVAQRLTRWFASADRSKRPMVSPPPSLR